MLKPYLLPTDFVQGIYKDYLDNQPQAQRFLGKHYTEPEVFFEKAERVSAGFRGNRELLASMLLSYNRELGCSDAVITQIEKMRQSNTVAVLCGQQAGLLTGPLYTIYKAAAAVKLASRLEKELQRPVVPIFWIAAEDHDFSEANHCYILDQENRPQRLQLELAHEGEPVGQMALTQEAGRDVLESLADAVLQTEFVPEILSLLEETRQASATPADWFARIMARLFAAEGLVFFNPLLAEAREMIIPLFRQVIFRREVLQEALSERETALRSHGYALQVEREPDATFLMYLDKKRTALYFRDGRFTTRDGSLSFSEEELLRLADTSPGSLSPNVLLRPLVQDALFPTVAFIPGPGETAYFAQVMALYPVFGIEPPVLSPRPGLTLVEPRLVRYIEKYEIAERELLGDLDGTLTRELKKRNELDIDSVFAHLRSHLAVEYDHLKGELSRLNPQLNTLADKNLQHVYNQVRYLEDKAQEAYKKKNEGIIRHFAALSQTLNPNNKLQERVFSILPFLMKYGPEFWEQLLTEFPDQPGHYLFTWGSGFSFFN